MSEIKDGGTAFPVPPYLPEFQGISVRDWFAGMAISGLAKYDLGTTAENAYIIADALIAEREKSK